jgi:hypothetical protein
MIGMHFTSPTPADPIHDVDWVRIWDMQVDWARVHVGPNQFDWARLDDFISRYATAGAKILYTVHGTPAWACEAGTDDSHYAPWMPPKSNGRPFSPDVMVEFVNALLARYAGRIHAIEVGNELQLREFCANYDTKTLNFWAAMTQKVYQNVKKNHPGVLVLANPVLPRPTSGGIKKGQKYWDALAKKGWPIDAFSCHIYPKGPDKCGKLFMDLFNETKAAVKAQKAHTKKLWVTEYNLAMLERVLPSDKQDKYLKKIYTETKGAFLFPYAWNRVGDLQGVDWSTNGAGWSAVKKYGK